MTNARQQLLFCICILSAAALIARPVFASDPAWEAYYQQSRQLRAADQAAIDDELKRWHLKAPKPARPARRFSLPGHDARWLTSQDAQRIADSVLSYQTPSGGWSKGTDFISAPRESGQLFGVQKHYIPTFDNNATTEQIIFLAQVHEATGRADYREAIERAIGLILEAQYPNGCWPQTFPLVGGYHDLITFNDAVAVNLLNLLQRYAEQQADFASIANTEHYPDYQRRVLASIDRGIQCLLDTQVEVDGTLTAWGAQHEVNSLAPAAARSYEMVSLASQESAQIVRFLMQVTDPDPRIINAVNSAVRWLVKTRIDGYVWRRNSGNARLERSSDGHSLWARFYEIGTNRPLFGDRDGSVHYDINDISQERRLHYGWYTGAPAQLIQDWRQWKARYSPP